MSFRYNTDKSLQPQAQAVSQQSEEDALQRAIELSLAGGVGSNVGQRGGGDGAGWGGRLQQQQQQEEEQYRRNQEEEASRDEEQLRQALAMSMDVAAAPDAAPVQAQTRPRAPAPVPAPPPGPDPVQAGWPQLTRPSPGSLQAAGPMSAPTPVQLPRPGPAPTPAELPRPGPAPGTAAGPAEAVLRPLGPGHTLGGGRGAAASPQTEDPQEIRRRRLAFLDNMQRSQDPKEK